MSSFLHGLIAIAYVVAGLAVAIVLALGGPGVAPAVAGLTGFAVAIAGAFVHLGLVQARNQRALAATLGGLGTAYERLDTGLAGSRAEVRRLVAAFEEATRQLPEQACGELVSEMRLLQSVLQQLAPPSAVAQAMPIADAPPAPPAEGYDDSMLALIRHCLHDNRVDIYLQPVVSLPSARPPSTRPSPACAAPRTRSSSPPSTSRSPSAPG